MKFTTVILVDGRKLDVKTLTAHDLFEAAKVCPNLSATGYYVAFIACTWANSSRSLTDEDLKSISVEDSNKIMEAITVQMNPIPR